MLLKQLLTATATTIGKFASDSIFKWTIPFILTQVNCLIQGAGAYPSSDSLGSRKICFPQDYTSSTTGGPAHKYNHRCLCVPFSPGPSALYSHAPASGPRWVGTFMFLFLNLQSGISFRLTAELSSSLKWVADAFPKPSPYECVWIYSIVLSFSHLTLVGCSTRVFTDNWLLAWIFIFLPCRTRKVMHS